MNDDPFADDELQEALQLAELEHRSAAVGAEVARVMRDAGLDFDAETFVYTDVVLAALDRGADADQVVEYFAGRGFLEQLRAALERRSS
jgi:hypothetical protein